ncbi:MAG: molybdopterin-dependent oxidoreductase [Anaerolineales bacterium]|nr:molybdopterin-dependent oxidoreductase [Anaerolineales bacterium]
MRPCGAFRGFGVTQSAFAVESNMDILAATLGIDPVELRRINGMQVGVTTATGQVLKDSVGMMDCIDQVEDEIERWWAHPELWGRLPGGGTAGRLVVQAGARRVQDVGLGLCGRV